MFWSYSSEVEHYVDIVGVTGSIPVVTTIFKFCMKPLKSTLILFGSLTAFILLTYQESKLPDHSVFFIGGDNLYDVMKQDSSFSNNFIFWIVDALPELKTRIKTGEYLLTHRENAYSFVLKLLSSGFVRRKITFREGLTVRQIIEQLNKNSLLVGEVTKIPTEGSLMPDTYFYKFGDTRKSIINRMQDEMHKFKKQKIKLNKTSLNWNEIVTLGSLIELEAGHDKDRPIVSSVLHNRLKKGQPLECCPTIIYALSINGKTVNRTSITYKDLFFKSSYNTYRNKGLPPTPICCPSRASILAAMNPAETKYYYYISNLYTKETFYSETFQQHVKKKIMLKNVKKPCAG